MRAKAYYRPDCRCNEILENRMMASRIIVGLVAIVLPVIAHGQSSSATGGKKMKITSSAFQQGANIPSKFSCDGADTSPPLQIQEIPRSEEHTSELQSRFDLVCRLLLEKKKK